MDFLFGAWNPTLYKWREPWESWTFVDVQSGEPHGPLEEVKGTVFYASLAWLIIPIVIFPVLHALYYRDHFLRWIGGENVDMGFAIDFYSILPLIAVGTAVGAGVLSCIVLLAYLGGFRGWTFLKERGIKIGVPSDMLQGYWWYSEFDDYSIVRASESREVSTQAQGEVVLSTIYGRELTRTIPAYVQLHNLARVLERKMNAAGDVPQKEFGVSTPLRFLYASLGVLPLYQASIPLWTSVNAITWILGFVFFLFVGGGLGYYGLRTKLTLLEDGIRVNWKWWGNSEIAYADIEEVMFKTVGGAGKIGVILKTPVQRIKLAGMQDQFPLGRAIARRAIPHGATVTGNPSGVTGGEQMDLTPRSPGV